MGRALPLRPCFATQHSDAGLGLERGPWGDVPGEPSKDLAQAEQELLCKPIGAGGERWRVLSGTGVSPPAGLPGGELGACPGSLNCCLFSKCCWSREVRQGKKKPQSCSVIYVVKEISGDLKRREYIIETNV